MFSSGDHPYKGVIVRFTEAFHKRCGIQLGIIIDVERDRGSRIGTAVDNDLKKLLDDPKIEEMLLKSEWLWNQYNSKGTSEQSPQEATYAVVCLIKATEKLIDKRGVGVAPKPETTPNKKVIITKTGKVIELSDEGSQTPSGSNVTSTPSVVENINNLQNILKDKSDENVDYVKDYVNDWIDTLMKTKFDMDTMLSLFEAEELRTKTFQVLKKLRADVL